MIWLRAVNSHQFIFYMQITGTKTNSCEETHRDTSTFKGCNSVVSPLFIYNIVVIPVISLFKKTQKQNTVCSAL